MKGDSEIRIAPSGHVDDASHGLVEPTRDGSKYRVSPRSTACDTIEQRARTASALNRAGALLAEGTAFGAMSFA